MTPLLTIREAAELLSIDSKTLRLLISEGKIPVVTTTPTIRGDRIDTRDLEAYRDNSKITRGAKCQSMSAVKSGGASSKLAASELEKALGKPAKGKLKNSKGGYVPNTQTTSIGKERAPLH